jgi:hypothetical protein
VNRYGNDKFRNIVKRNGNYQCQNNEMIDDETVGKNARRKRDNTCYNKDSISYGLKGQGMMSETLRASY